MWDFLQYTSGEYAFSFSQSSLEMTGAGVGVDIGVQASKTALRIFCKLSLEYLEILVAEIGTLATGDFIFEGPVNWSDNLSTNLGGKEESERTIEKATEEEIERSSRQERLWPQIEIILMQTSF